MLHPEPRYIIGEGIAPLRYFKVRVNRSVFFQFEQQMFKFADTFSFENKSRQSSPSPYDIFFIFQRNDVKLYSSNDSLFSRDAQETNKFGFDFSIGFYPKHDRPSPPQENVNVLVEGLKTFLAPVDGVTLTDVTQSRR
jgi:hypothetical protein